MSDLARREQPHSLEAEQGVIGGILNRGSALDIALEYLTPQDFYFEKFQLIFTTMIRVHETHEPVDLLVITAILRESGQLAGVGGATALSELMVMVPSAVHVASYAQIVKKHAIQRRVIAAGLRIVHRAFEPVADVGSFLAEAENAIVGVATAHESAASTAEETAAGVMDRLELRDAARISTGFASLDADLGGFLRGALIVVGARPGAGKSLVATKMSLKGAAANGIPAFQHSLEMSREELMLREVADRCEIPNWKLQRGNLGPLDHAPVSQALMALAKQPWFIRDRATTWDQDLRAYDRVVRERKVGMVVVDHVGLIRGVPGPSNQRRDLVIGEITASLLAFARYHQVVVILLSQLNRASEKESREPGLHDLRDSGSLEQDASVVIFLHTPDKDASGDEEQVLDVLVAKNRQGPTGRYQLGYVKRYCRLIDPLERYRAAEIPLPDEQLSPQGYEWGEEVVA